MTAWWCSPIRWLGASSSGRGLLGRAYAGVEAPWPTLDECAAALQLVERAVLLRQVVEHRLRIQRPADGLVDELRRRQQTAVTVDLLAQPDAQRAELAALQLGVEVG